MPPRRTQPPPAQNARAGRRVTTRRLVAVIIPTAAAEANGEANADDDVAIAFRFLDLPSELRELIYAYAAAHCKVISVKAAGSKGPLIGAHHPLSYGCRQTRLEFSAALGRESLVHAPSILGEATDFDFTNLQAYIRRVKAQADPADFDFMPDPQAPTRPLLSVSLTITKNWSNNPATKKLLTWLEFVEGNVKQTPDEPSPVIYDFVEVEDQDLTGKIMDGIGSGVHLNEGLLQLKSRYDTWCRIGRPKEAVQARHRAEFFRQLRAGELDEDVYEEQIPEIEEDRLRVHGQV